VPTSKLSVLIPTEIYKYLQVYCVIKGESQQYVVANLLRHLRSRHPMDIPEDI
jgi:hypothetical protein